MLVGVEEEEEERKSARARSPSEVDSLSGRRLFSFFSLLSSLVSLLFSLSLSLALHDFRRHKESDVTRRGGREKKKKREAQGQWRSARRRDIIIVVSFASKLLVDAKEGTKKTFQTHS